MRGLYPKVKMAIEYVVGRSYNTVGDFILQSNGLNIFQGFWVPIFIFKELSFMYEDKDSNSRSCVF